MCIYICKYARGKNGRKKGKKECQRPIFQASFRLKEKRTLWRPRRRRQRVASPLPRAVPSFDSVYFSRFRIFLVHYQREATIHTAAIPPRVPYPFGTSTPSNPTIHFPPFCPAPWRRPTTAQCTAGTIQTATVAWWVVVVGGFVFKSFFLILTLTNTHRFIISCLPPPTYTHTHEHSAVTNTIASYFVYIYYVCVRVRRTTLFHLS